MSQIIKDVKDFTSVLLSCELAHHFNDKQPNKAIRNCLRKCHDRVESKAVKAKCKEGLSNMYPLGWLSKQIHTIGRVNKSSMSRDEILGIGASL
ncbi:hypothetical protein NVP1091O_54 [Vibrio phage 1.091.O._10N.286.52.B12]|nr:hypothetical protein NVP1091O_54 [Vibrio phage 1.091.O._10N.286.52.B12]